ncbi:hypothetical protein MKW92_030456 [Papaver armeniacum]|nr:hypothetical protein MKW92_030456 [Papaver armeniacum]
MRAIARNEVVTDKQMLISLMFHFFCLAKEYVICRIKRTKRRQRSFASFAPQLQPQSVPLVSKKPSPPIPVPGQSSSSIQLSVYEVGSSPSTPSSANIEPLILMRGIHCDMNGFSYSSANMAPSIDRVQPQPLNSKAGLSLSQMFFRVADNYSIADEFVLLVNELLNSPETDKEWNDDCNLKSVEPAAAMPSEKEGSSDDNLQSVAPTAMPSHQLCKEWSNDNNLLGIAASVAAAAAADSRCQLVRILPSQPDMLHN